MQLKVYGEYALFSRPEFKAEPHSYPVPPPTAMLGLLKSIFWKPEIEFQINRIVVLKPIRFTSMLRNMIQVIQSSSQSDGCVIEEVRTQRNHVFLKDVAYLLDFDIKLLPHAQSPLGKYTSIMHKRIVRGQYFKHPCLGCREFPAYFSLPDGSEMIDPEIIGMGRHKIGALPLKMNFIKAKKGKLEWVDAETKKIVKGSVNVEFFQAVMDKGVVEVPRC